MKHKSIPRSILIALLAAVCVVIFTACGGMYDGKNGGYMPAADERSAGGDEFTDFAENDFLKAADQPESFFSMDVSTASYAVIRNYIDKGLTIDKNMVKIEEMVNYFKYSYPQPAAGEPLSIGGSLFPCPWNGENLLLSIGLRAKDIERGSVRNNLVFLIDTSGSMDSDSKLGLLQEAFYLLADNLSDDDTVSVVTYAGSSATLLDGARGAERLRIKNVISDLKAGGSTGGAGGIRRAYEVAEKHFITGGNNRVILATDGDFNVGISSQPELKSFISGKRAQSKGVYLSVMGFGLGNLKNNTMDTLAQNGNGNAYYIDGLLEAKKVMVEEMQGTLVTVADDVKAGVRFNPDKVDSYRLLGYETKLLTADDWENAAADAGEIGAGHTVTALYEVKLASTFAQTSAHAVLGDSCLQASVRYKEPYAEERPDDDTRTVKELSKLFGAGDILTPEQFAANGDLLFQSAVAEAALLFKNSQYKADASIAAVLERLTGLPDIESDEYRADFLQLVTKWSNRYSH
jgi:Ca-activated chloride channel family protein